MLKFVVIVLCHLILDDVSKVLSVPIIKASGVQWSEPKGSGTGNITLIMIPQNNSCGNDSDVIVAVKSEYQILSQDTQLLNLVVNEETNTTCSGKRRSSRTPTCTAAAPLSTEEQVDRNKLRCPNTASYFQPVKKQFIDAVSNNSVNELNRGKQINTEQAIASTVNIFKLLNLVDPNEKKISTFTVTQTPSAVSTNNLFKLLNAPVTASFNQNNLQSTAKAVGGGESETTPFDSEDSFYNEAMSVIEKLKQDPTYYESIVAKPNPANISDASRKKPAYHDSNFLGGYLAPLEEDTGVVFENEKLKLDEIDPAILAACLSSTMGNQPSSIGASEQQLLVTPSSLESAATDTASTIGSVEQISGESAATGTASTTGNVEQISGESAATDTALTIGSVEQVSGESPATGTASTIGSVEQVSGESAATGTASTTGGVEQSTSEGYNQTTTSEIAGIFPATAGSDSISYAGEQSTLFGDKDNGLATEICTTIIVRCDSLTTNVPGVFNQIVNMFNGTGTETTPPGVLSSVETVGMPQMTVSKSVEVVPNEGVDEVMNAAGAAGGNSDTSVSCNVSSTTPQYGKLPRKITLESRISCDTLLKINALTASAEQSADNSEPQLKEFNPLLKSVVCLENKNEMSKGKEIPLSLNTSLDEFSLTDLEDSSDKMHGKAAKLYNSDALEPDLEQIKPIERSSAETNPVKLNDKRRVLIRNRSRDRGKIINPDLSRVLKMQFAGKNLILKQKPAYRYEMNNKNCDSTQKKMKNDLPHSGVEPNDEEANGPNIEPKEELPVVKTHPTSITQHLNDQNDQNEQITTHHSHSDEDRGVKKTLNGNGYTRRPVSNESQGSNNGVDKMDMNENKHKTTDTFAECEETEDKSVIDMQSTTKIDIGRRTKPNSDSATISIGKLKGILPRTDEELQEPSSRCDSLYETTTQIVTEEVSPAAEFRVAVPTSRSPERNHCEEEADKTEAIDERGKVAAKKGRIQLTASEEQTTDPVDDSRARCTTEGKCQTKSCGQKINIPANSVKEIVIKIIRTTREPTNIENTDSDTCYNIEREQNGLRPLFARPLDSRKLNYGYEDNLAPSNIKPKLERPTMTGLDVGAPQSRMGARVLDGVGQEQAQFGAQQASPYVIKNYGFPKRINYQQYLQNGVSLGEMYPVGNSQKSEHQYPLHTSTEQQYPSEQAVRSMDNPNIIHDLSDPSRMVVDRNGKSLGSSILKLLLNDKPVIKSV